MGLCSILRVGRWPCALGVHSVFVTQTGKHILAGWLHHLMGKCHLAWVSLQNRLMMAFLDSRPYFRSLPILALTPAVMPAVPLISSELESSDTEPAAGRLPIHLLRIIGCASHGTEAEYERIHGC